MGLKLGKNDVWWCPSLALSGVASSAAMGLKSGKKRCLVVFLANASGFYCSMETAKAQLQNWRFGFLLLDGNR